MASFLAPLIDGLPARDLLRNQRTRLPLAAELEPAFDSKRRRRGLLGRMHFDRGAAMILAPCTSVHTFFMRFPIDVVFVCRSGRVVKVCANLRPWRISVAWRAFAAIELPAGAAAASGTQRGDLLQIEPRNSIPDLGAPQARPPERSGAVGPRERRRGGSAGAKPPGSKLDTSRISTPDETYVWS